MTLAWKDKEQQMKIRIYMKNGTILPDLECSEFVVQRNDITGKAVGYEFRGGKVPCPLFIDMDEVLAIWRICDETS